MICQHIINKATTTQYLADIKTILEYAGPQKIVHDNAKQQHEDDGKKDGPRGPWAQVRPSLHTSLSRWSS